MLKTKLNKLKKKGRLFAVTLKRAVLGNWNIFPEKNMLVGPLC